MALPRAALLLSAVDPNDPAASDTWTDVAKTRMLRVKNAGRGRQYELGQSIAGRMDADLLNIDEYLNPANASSPLLSTAKLMRRTRLMMVLPADGVGNLVNLNNIKGDPSFESYPVGGAPFPQWWGNQPLVTATNPHSGTRAMAQTISPGGALQGWTFELRLIPGDVYTMSVWVHQTAANTLQWGTNTPDWNHGVALATTSTVGAYVKLVGTFTASQPVMEITLTTLGATAATLTCDEIQVEQGSVATAFTTTGPRIRGVWGGHVEKLPITWDTGSNGYTGTAHLSAVGPLAAIAQIGVKTDWGSVMAAKKPDYWWALWDGSKATTWAEISGNNGPPLVQGSRAATGSGSYTPPTISPGTAVSIAGNPGASGVTIDYPNPVGQQPVTYLQAGMNGAAKIDVDATAVGSAVTVAVWIMWPGAFPTNGGIPWALIDSALSSDFYMQWSGNFSAPFSTFNIKTDAPNNGTPDASVDGLAINTPHLVIAALKTTVSGVQLKLYIDGALSVSSGVVAGHLANRFDVITLGAFATPTGAGDNRPGMKGGVYTDLAIWKKELTAQDVTDLWTAGQGYPGDTTGQRLSRLFGLYYVGPTVIDNGRTKLGPSGAVDGTKLGQLAQRIVDSEAGGLSENRDAALELDGRDTRFLSTVSQATFGENTAAGEIPYRDTPTFGYDTAQLNNQATVNQTGGTKATASDAASIKSYYQRSIQVTTDTQSGLEAIDYSNWLVANRKQPKQRVERITLDPGANPSIQAAVLDLELNQRYTLKRVAKAGNNGAGVTMTGDFFLENINHRDFDPEKGTWLVDLILSPAPLQPWILGDPTWGQLGITTVLGF